jgi:predicted N-acyltransferase
VLDLRWPSFDAYLTDRPSKNRREFRRQISRYREGGGMIELMDGTRPDERRLLELLDFNARKHGGRRFAFREGFVEALTSLLSPRTRIFMARKSGSISGVCLMLVEGDTAFPFAVGVDPETASDDFTYFQLAYNSLIADAIASGVRRMYYGRGMYEVKVRRGCSLLNSWVYSRRSGGRRVGLRAWFALASSWNRYKLSPAVRRALIEG